jgi:hypothetical protein
MKYEDISVDLEQIDSSEKLQTEISRLESLVAQGEGKACFELSLFCSPVINMPLVLAQPVLTEERGLELVIQGYPLLMEEAEQGDGEAMALIAIYYQSGWPPVECDMQKFYEWQEKAFAAGYRYSAIELYYHYSNPSSYNAERAEFYKQACLEVGHDPDYMLELTENTDAGEEGRGQ